jgi:uncharacterized membrane protein YphA (DoxX/SURF4 family)
MIKTASIFSIFCGFAMLVVWGILLAKGQFVDLRSRPYQDGFLLAAEFLTAISLIFGGFGILMGKKWGTSADLAALGMLLYCTVYSTGVFRQSGNLPAAGFFIVVAILAAFFSAIFILGSLKGGIQ